MRQIIGNLLSNAIKFTDAGEISVLARQNGPAIEVSVRDTGIGVSPDFIEHLFSPFRQADPSTTRKHGGTGLGLAIVKELISEMGGSVAVQSALGEGSIFRLVLPLERTEGESASKLPNAEPLKGEPLLQRHLQVLAAEDNEMNRRVLEALLSQLGVSLSLAANGEEALECWRTGAWDLILMDVQMPVMDGLEATRAIRQEESARGIGRTPIVAFTADAMPHHVTEYREAGMDGLIAKPIDLRDLIDVLQQIARSAEPLNGGSVSAAGCA